MKEIWDKLQSIYEVDMQDVCDVKRLYMEDESIKDSKSVKYHEPDDDSSASMGKFNGQDPKKMQSTIKLKFCCYCRTISHLSSKCFVVSTSESEICSSRCSEDRSTLIAMIDLDIGQEDNGTTSSEEKQTF